MRLLDEHRALSFVCASLAGFAFASSRADESAKIDSKAQHRIVVKPGTIACKAARPITPTSFDVEIGALATGGKVLVEMEIRNTSTTPIKILGGNAGCSYEGCVKPEGKYPRIVPPGGADKIEVVYTAPILKDAKIGRNVHLDAFFYIGAATTFAVPYRISGEILPEAMQALPNAH